MSHTVPWRHFKRAQDGAAAVGVLIYAGAAAYAWRVLPGAAALKAQVMLVYPAIFLVAIGSAPLLIRPARRGLSIYVWSSFLAGFGQTFASITGSGLLMFGAAAFIVWRIADVHPGGAYPAGVFCGYAAGVGVLLAQVILTRRLEREPDVRAVIEADGSSSETPAPE